MKTTRKSLAESWIRKVIQTTPSSIIRLQYLPGGGIALTPKKKDQNKEAKL